MLHTLASENHASKIRSLILSGQAKINEVDGNGWTVSSLVLIRVYELHDSLQGFIEQALHYSAFAGSEALLSMKMLIELQADVDYANQAGGDPSFGYAFFSRSRYIPIFHR